MLTRRFAGPYSKGRLKPLPSGKMNRSVLDQQTLRDEQIYLVQAIANWYADSAGNKIMARNSPKIIRRNYKWSIIKGSFFHTSQKLKDPGYAFTKLVAGCINQVSHKTFLEGKARELDVECSKEGVFNVQAPLPTPVTDK